jgi:hypothetical protein
MFEPCPLFILDALHILQHTTRQQKLIFASKTVGSQCQCGFEIQLKKII